MGVTPDDVRRLADLARLTVSPAEAAVIADQLRAIIEHMTALGVDRGVPIEVGPDDPVRVDPAGVDPAGVDPDPAAPHFELSSAEPGGLRQDRMAPAWSHGYFTVPRALAGPPGSDA